ncbi:unnamed protein product [Lupinus luteus]|uniref:Uncharacterized protein n=1 Tax=Lupinus luteus TaxID=3873 RepID=A0AAV1XDE0_LUPLU
MWQKKHALRFRIPWRRKQISNSSSESDTNNANVSIQKMVFGTQKDMNIVSSTDPVTNNVSSTSTISPQNPPPQASVVTLAGENKGATMHIGSSSKKQSSIHIHRAYKTNQTEETTTDEDENSCDDSMEKIFVNSNIQRWDSSTLDPKSATLERNQSLTKEEINAFWRTKKKIEEEHLRAVSKLSENIQVSKYKEIEKFHSSTVPLARIKESLDMDADTNLEQLIKKNGWWTKSRWAFLNEPPIMEAASNKYASQFHVPNLGSSKSNTGDGVNV